MYIKIVYFRKQKNKTPLSDNLIELEEEKSLLYGNLEYSISTI